MIDEPADGGIVLRAVEPDDGELIYSWFQDEWFRHIFGYRYPASRGNWIEWATANKKPSYERATFMICARESGTAVGLGTLRTSAPEDRSAEISLALGTANVRNRGLGREAAVRLCRFGFEIMGLRRVYCWILASNTPAISICDALGATREGVARRARLVAGKPMDLILYGLLAEELAPDRHHAAVSPVAVGGNGGQP